jgi:hypothetical protein
VVVLSVAASLLPLEHVESSGCAAPIYFSEIYASHPQLGCPTFASSSKSTIQEFAHGLMIWRQRPSPSRIYVLSHYSSWDGWTSYVDPTRDPEIAANADFGCPEYQQRSQHAHVTGFFTLWCEPWNWKLNLGDPLADERDGGPNSTQDFENGTVFWPQDAPKLILYTDGTWEAVQP